MPVLPGLRHHCRDSHIFHYELLLSIYTLHREHSRSGNGLLLLNSDEIHVEMEIAKVYDGHLFDGRTMHFIRYFISRYALLAI